MGVPGGILPLVILVEFGGGLALLFGFKHALQLSVLVSLVF